MITKKNFLTFLILQSSIIAAQCNCNGNAYTYKDPSCKPGKASDCNSMCFPAADCSKRGTNFCGDLSPQTKKTIVNLHNKLRSQIASGKEERGKPGPQPKGTNINELVWDDNLAKLARRWAEQQKEGHDCKHCRKIGNLNSIGQNAASLGRRGGAKMDWESAIYEWYDEVRFWNGKTNKRSDRAPKNEQTTHYSQLVWAKTTRIGCGAYSNRERCPKKRSSKRRHKECQHLVCNYYPAGNMKYEGRGGVVEEPVFNSTKKCRKYSSKYPTLCAT